MIADIQDKLGKALAEKLGENVCYIHCDVRNESGTLLTQLSQSMVSWI